MSAVQEHIMTTMSEYLWADAAYKSQQPVKSELLGKLMEPQPRLRTLIDRIMEHRPHFNLASLEVGHAVRLKPGTDLRKVSHADLCGVYFLQADSGDGFVKIGQSVMVPRRVLNLQVGSPVRLAIAAVFPVVDESRLEELEYWFHCIFQDFWQHGEWFDIGQTEIEFMAEILPLYQTDLKRFIKTATGGASETLEGFDWDSVPNENPGGGSK